jgi:hypothetical protein
MIERLCSRFHVSSDFGRLLLPLVQRALRSTPDKRRLILEMVERSFVEEARQVALSHGLSNASEWWCLTAVARLLHDWELPVWLGEAGPPAPGAGA